MVNENKTKVEEKVLRTLLANEVISKKQVTLELKEGTITEEGSDREPVIYQRYSCEIVGLDKDGKTLVNYIKDQNGKTHKVPQIKEFSIPKEVGDQVATAILRNLQVED